MTNSEGRHRGARRLVSTLAATALVGTGAIATTGIAHAEEPTSQAKLETFDADDFATQAGDLPGGLSNAIERDLEISPAQYLANAAAAKSAADVAAGLQADGVAIESVAINNDQEVTLYVSADADVDAAAAVGATVEVGAPASADYSQYEFEAKRDFKGGFGYVAYDQDDNLASRCSAGFNGYDADGNARFLSAGHCGFHPTTGAPLAAVDHLDLEEPIGLGDVPPDAFGDPIGAFVPDSSHFGGDDEPHDASLLDITEPGWENVPQVAGWDGANGHPDEASVTIHDSIAPVVGAEACKSGATSGWTCGEISDAETTIELGTGESVAGFVFDACMLGGDSGGSIVVGNFALGVNSASNFSDCDTGDLSLGYAVEGVDGSENNAFALYGDQWELNVEVNAPEVNTASRKESDTTTTFRGTVENAGPNHRLQVSLEGVGDFEPDIDEDGQFSIEVDEALEFGAEVNFTAQAFYGEFSESEVASGSVVVTQQVEDLVVESPSDGQTAPNPRPPFEGTGEPGADVTLTVGDEEVGASTVDDEGGWEIAPDSDLPSGVRFDATVTQTAGEDVQNVTVTDLGIELPEITITVPEDGDEVSGDVVFEGTSFPDASILLRIEGVISQSGAEPTLGAASGDLESAQEDEDMDTWPGEFEVDEEGNWMFTPDEPLEDGEYTVTAMATLEGGDPELTDSETSVDFTVVTVGDEEGDDELPDTGSNSLLFVLVGVGLLAAGGAALAIRARRSTSAV